jgi:uncharacterized protein YyaL (SSP411 family)
MRPAGILGVSAIAIGASILLYELLASPWHTKPAPVDTKTRTTDARVAAIGTSPPGDAALGTTVLRSGAVALEASYDAANGGFGTGPKSLPPAQLDFLMRWFRRTGDTKARDMVLGTLDAMSRGGIHDQVGGGFHHAATDSAWVVPNYQKTLADNALLSITYLDALAFGPNDEFKEVTNHTLALIQSLKAPGGGFYAAIGTASEGPYYTWSFTELRQVIDEWTWPFFSAYFPVTAVGDVDGMNVLHAPRAMSVVAADLGRDVPSTWVAVRAQLARLRVIRARRPAPAIDRNVNVAWNGLAISALTRAGRRFGGDFYGREAARSAAWILDHLHLDGRLARMDPDGVIGGEATLDDYVFLIAGLLDLFDVTQDARWLREALALQSEQDQRFHDDVAGGYFRTPEDAGSPPVREKPWRDEATPSGNAVAARNLLRLAELTGDATRRERAEATLRAFAPLVTESPALAPAMLSAAEFLLDRPKEIVIVVPEGADAHSLLKQVYAAFVPDRALVVVTEGKPRNEALVPLVAGKTAKDGLATAYVCEARVCGFTTTDPAALARELGSVTPLPPS